MRSLRAFAFCSLATERGGLGFHALPVAGNDACQTFNLRGLNPDSAVAARQLGLKLGELGSQQFVGKVSQHGLKIRLPRRR
jgi:hypothetical protein